MSIVAPGYRATPEGNRQVFATAGGCYLDADTPAVGECTVDRRAPAPHLALGCHHKGIAVFAGQEFVRLGLVGKRLLVAVDFEKRAQRKRRLPEVHAVVGEVATYGRALPPRFRVPCAWSARRESRLAQQLYPDARKY